VPVSVVSGLIGSVLDGGGAAGHYSPGHRRGNTPPAAPAPTLVDVVELSEAAPRPVDVDFLRDADLVAGKLAGAGDLTGREKTRMREDRVFAAMSALLLVGAYESGYPAKWPGGLPTPSPEEVQEAYRRLSQRLMRLDSVRDAYEMQSLRQTVLDSLRGQDLPALVSGRLG